MRFAILLHRQAFMYIHVHVLRGFQTYILLFLCSLIYSVPLLFLCFCFASYCCTCVAVSVCVCLWEKTFAIEFLRPIAIHVSTCSGCIGLLTSCFDIPQAWRKASVMCRHCSWQRLALITCGVPRVVSLRGFGNRQMGEGLSCMAGARWPQMCASCWCVQLF